MKQQVILIIGAGMGGLTAGLALQRFGHHVRIFEQAPNLEEVGAGLTVGPNATHVLEYLGLGEDIARYADIPDAGAVKHYRSGATLVSTYRGDTPRQLYGANYYQIHRADLHGLLTRAVLSNDPACIHLGHNFKHLEQGSDRVIAHFENGESAQGDILVGCDGTRSTVRAQLFSLNPLRFTGDIAWRGLVPADLLTQDMMTPSSAMTIGPGQTFTRYFVRKRTLVNYVAGQEKSGWEIESWSERSTVEEVLAAYDGWHEHVRGIIAATPPELCFKWALFDRDPLPEWSRGRVTLLGDAAHASLPYLGQGAAMAFEDALVLARCLDQASDPSTAFKIYEAVRQPRTRWVMESGRIQGERYKSQDPDSYDSELHAPTQSKELFGYKAATIELPKL